jgi:effector-binding domain-containing protein
MMLIPDSWRRLIDEGQKHNMHVPTSMYEYVIGSYKIEEKIARSTKKRVEYTVCILLVFAVCL